MIDDDPEGNSLEAKYNGLVLEYQDICNALGEIDGLGGEDFVSGPYSPADLVRGLVGLLKEQQAEIDRLKEKAGEVERCARCLQPLTNKGLCKGEDRPHLAPDPLLSAPSLASVSVLKLFRKKP